MVLLRVGVTKSSSPVISPSRREGRHLGRPDRGVGSAPVLGATNLAAVQIGEKRAKEMSFLCRRYAAKQALAMGLINAVVDDGELDAEVER